MSPGAVKLLRKLVRRGLDSSAVVSAAALVAALDAREVPETPTS